MTHTRVHEEASFLHPAEVEISRSAGTVTVSMPALDRDRRSKLWIAWLGVGGGITGICLLDVFDANQMGGSDLDFLGNTASVVVIAVVLAIGGFLWLRHGTVRSAEGCLIEIGGGCVSLYRKRRGLTESEMVARIPREEIRAMGVWSHRSGAEALWFETDRDRLPIGAGLPHATLGWLCDFVAAELEREINESADRI